MLSRLKKKEKRRRSQLNDKINPHDIIKKTNWIRKVNVFNNFSSTPIIERYYVIDVTNFPKVLKKQIKE